MFSASIFIVVLTFILGATWTKTPKLCRVWLEAVKRFAIKCISFRNDQIAKGERCHLRCTAPPAGLVEENIFFKLPTWQSHFRCAGGTLSTVGLPFLLLIRNQIHIKLFMLWHTSKQQLFFSGLKKENRSLSWSKEFLQQGMNYIVHGLLTCKIDITDMFLTLIYCLLPSPGSSVNPPFLWIIKNPFREATCCY